MQIIKTVQELQNWRAKQQQEISFVPTMGFLHEGHLSLIKKAHELTPLVVISIFVNPLQFNNTHDLASYPENISQDLTILQKHNVDVVFLPNKNEVYPNEKPQIKLSYPSLMSEMCGKYRTDHFEGVLLVCYKFFHWLKPKYAIFGLKDYQQYKLVKQMSIDLDLAVEVVGSPLVRNSDGLALSSRNVRLSKSALKKSLHISKTLFRCKEMVEAGSDINVVRKYLQKELIQNNEDYADLYIEETLTPLGDQWLNSATILVAVAVTIDGVRLIDNVLIYDHKKTKSTHLANNI